MKNFLGFLEQTKGSGYVNFFAATDITKPKGSRHRANIIRDIGNRKHVQTVPEYLKPDPDIILKVEKLKDNYSHYEPINNIQLKQICKKYKIYSISKNEVKKLGNTGISIVWDNNLKTFALKK
jgi:transposase